MGEQTTEHTKTLTLRYIPAREIRRVMRAVKDPHVQARVAADMFRVNALYMIRSAGSGHPGSTFSAIDILTWLWMRELRDPNTKTGDTFFSSKGHDIPGLYALLIGLGHIQEKYLHAFRRLDGLPGHPDIEIPYIATNTGSLGMGISKARGMAFANRLSKKRRNIYVLLGDGELQEGQIWESLQPTANHNFGEITAIVDHNKFQSDMSIADTSNLGDLEDKFRAFGWEVARCNGHDTKAIQRTLNRFRKIRSRPKLLIADTVKGAGVSFMTRPRRDGLYTFHSGAPSPDEYVRAVGEIHVRLCATLRKTHVSPPTMRTRVIPVSITQSHVERLVSAYSDELISIAHKRRSIVAMDGDLALDHGLLPFRAAFPDRYVQCGIAEQDMVSFAGGLALRGVLPVVHSFECFLTTRANEQFYNNASERTKIIYVGALAGLLPATPGHSHQSLRGISTLGSIPGLVLIQPANEAETRLTLRWAVGENRNSSYIRLTSVPCECPYTLPSGYRLKEGRGAVLRQGTDIVIIGYGPVMLSEAMKAADILGQENISVRVINMPWLNKIDGAWLAKMVGSVGLVVTLDDHYVTLGQGVQIVATLAKSGYSGKTASFGIKDIPACGQATEVLRHHKLDGDSLATRIQGVLGDA